MKSTTFLIVAIIVAFMVFGLASLVGNEYVYFAGYTVLQYIVLATAWNILGGYTGYVNFGTAGFFAIGAYTSVVIYKTIQLPLLLAIPFGGIVCGLLGLGMGYLALRLRGVFFSIAPLAFAIVLSTLIVNWSFVGGSRGVYIIRPRDIAFFDSYVQFLFATMLGLAVLS